jgi:hypothetical protein
MTPATRREMAPDTSFPFSFIKRIADRPSIFLHTPFELELMLPPSS